MSLTKTLRNPHLLFPFFILFISAAHALDIDITDFGAKGDGKTDASPAFLKAWNIACSSLTPTNIYVPRKRYFLSQAIFEGPCVNSGITFQINGILVAPDFKSMKYVDNWVKLNNVEGVSIIGGFLDGRGSSLWACKGSNQDCPSGASTLGIFGSKDITVRNLTSLNAKQYHVVVHVGLADLLM